MCRYTFLIYFCIPKIFKTNVSTLFLVQNHPLRLCSRLVNSQRLFCNQKLMRNVCIKAFWYLKIIFKHGVKIKVGLINIIKEFDIICLFVISLSLYVPFFLYFPHCYLFRLYVKTRDSALEAY